MKVYPAPGLRVRDPVTKQHISQEGHEVHDGDFFWARRVRDGDVVLEQPEYPAEDAPVEEQPAPANPAMAEDRSAPHEEDDQS